MVRFLLVGLVWLTLVGGVATYMHVRDTGRQTGPALVNRELDIAAQSYNLELTLTCDVQPDPFALDTDDANKTPLVSVRLNGTQVVTKSSGITPGEPWTSFGLPGVVVGNNELLIEATPPTSMGPSRCAVRVHVTTDGQTLADQTFWNERGTKIVGTLPFKATTSESEDDHDH